MRRSWSPRKRSAFDGSRSPRRPLVDGHSPPAPPEAPGPPAAPYHPGKPYRHATIWMDLIRKSLPAGVGTKCRLSGGSSDRAIPRTPHWWTQLCAWMRPGHGWMNSPTLSSDCGGPSTDRVGHNARPESRSAGRDIRNRTTTPALHAHDVFRSTRSITTVHSLPNLPSAGGRMNDRG
jgi:hypothetical protein